MNLGDILADAAAEVPDKIALSCGDATVTYAEFDARATRLAHGLRAAGIRQGDRVALHMGTTIEMALCYFACFRLGAIAVPINVRLKPAEIEYVLGHSEARLYIGEPGLYTRSATTPGFCPDDGFYVTTDAAPPVGFQRFDSLLEAPESVALPDVSGPDAAAILYTSGTTARPKGVTHSHDSLRYQAIVTISLGYRPGDTFLSFCPLAHASGLTVLLLPAMLLRGESAFVPRFDANVALDTLERRRCTAMFGLPALLQALCRVQGEAARDVSSLRMCGAGGDSVSAKLQSDFQQRFGVGIQEGIGMTEGVPLCLNTPGRVRTGTVGQAAEGVEIRVVDDSGRTVEPGAVGELIARMPGTMLGYWNDAEATAATIRDGWLHTGDLVRMDEDGYVWFSGRKKEIIIRGGSNVAPQEVEEILLQHPAVFQAGVVGVPDPEFGESVVAFVSLKNGGRCSEPELIGFARQFLSDHKVPGKVHFLPDMPLGTTGKVSRKTLKESLQT
jgi:long-chain acyl-CoA synthetase